MTKAGVAGNPRRASGTTTGGGVSPCFDCTTLLVSGRFRPSVFAVALAIIPIRDDGDSRGIPKVMWF